jgi:hypothetical protein
MRIGSGERDSSMYRGAAIDGRQFTAFLAQMLGKFGRGRNIIEEQHYNTHLASSIVRFLSTIVAFNA